MLYLPISCDEVIVTLKHLDLIVFQINVILSTISLHTFPTNKKSL